MFNTPTGNQRIIATIAIKNLAIAIPAQKAVIAIAASKKLIIPPARDQRVGIVFTKKNLAISVPAPQAIGADTAAK